LKRDRQLSLFSGPSLRTASSSSPNTNPKRQSPARTTPPTSLFLPMQLSNSRGKDNRLGADPPRPVRPNPVSRQSAHEARPELEFQSLRQTIVRLERPKTPRPRLLAGRSTLKKSRNPAIGSPKARQTVGRRDIGRLVLSVNALSLKNPLLWISFAARAFPHASSCRPAASASRAAAA
jgi:hypothetical protein